MPGSRSSKTPSNKTRSNKTRPIDDVPAHLEAEVHRLMAVRTRDLKLSDELLAYHRAYTFRHRGDLVRSWAQWAIAINLVLVYLYTIIIPQAFWTGVLVSGLIIPAANIVILIVWRRPRSALQEGLLTVLSLLVIAAAAVVLGAVAGGDNQERFAYASLFVMSTAIILISMQFVWSVILCIGVWLIFLVGQFANPHLSPSQAAAISVFYVCGMTALIFYRRTTSLLSARTFLITLTERFTAMALAEANLRLKALATLDPLTGLANRRYMNERLDALFADREQALAILMVDIDNFKALNDTAGHSKGDEAICRVGQLIADAVRADVDVVARYGGEEFLVVLRDATRDKALETAERLRAGVEALALANPGTQRRVLTVSVGVATRKDEIRHETVVNAADGALYAAKHGGRNCVRLATDDSVAHVDS